MFTIDLLKGQCIPAQTKPQDIIVAIVSLAVPIVVAIVMLGFYLNDGIAIAIQQNNLRKYEENTEKLSVASELFESLQDKRQHLCDVLSEVSSHIGSHMQWSLILAAVAENIPDSLVLSEFRTKHGSVTRKIPDKDNLEQIVNMTVPVTILQMKVNGDTQSDCDQAVRDFRDRLRSSAVLRPILRDIRVGKEFEVLEKQRVASYQIDCVFGTKL